MKKIILSAVITAVMATTASAGAYAGASIGFGSVIPPNTTTYYTGELPLKINAGLGGKSGFGIEGEFRMDIASGSINSLTQSMTLYGGYVTYSYEIPAVLDNKLGVKFGLGWMTGTMTDETSTSQSVGGIAYHAQITYDLLKNLDVYVEYADMIGGGADAAEFALGVFALQSYSVGAHYHF